MNKLQSRICIAGKWYDGDFKEWKEGCVNDVTGERSYDFEFYFSTSLYSEDGKISELKGTEFEFRSKIYILDYILPNDGQAHLFFKLKKE